MSRKGENIFKRKDGRWEARYIHHYEGGHAKYRFLYAHSYAEAKEKKLEEMRQFPKEPLIRSQCRFRELGNQWLESIKAAVKESSYARYQRILFYYLYPRIGEVSVGLLDARTCIALESTLLAEGGKQGGSLSPKTVSDIVCVLKTVSRYGRDTGYPCPDLHALRRPQNQKKPISTLSEDRRIALERALLDARDTVSLGVLVTLFTGLRIGELCGLRWEDVDLENGLIHVRRTVERIEDFTPGAAHKTKVIIGPPKTDNGMRAIPIQNFLIQYLRERKQSASCYLLTGNEQYSEPQIFYWRYRTLLKANGIPPTTFHALRHTFATRCVEAGFDVKSLAEILGHASVATTLSVYVHPSMQAKRRQMELLTPSYSQSESSS